MSNNRLADAYAKFTGTNRFYLGGEYYIDEDLLEHMEQFFLQVYKNRKCGRCSAKRYDPAGNYWNCCQRGKDKITCSPWTSACVRFTP